jgi:hypothetical protein
MHGPGAAAILAASEAGVGTLRTSRRWTSRLFSPASAALAMVASGALLHLALQALGPGRLEPRGPADGRHDGVFGAVLPVSTR